MPATDPFADRGPRPTSAATAPSRFWLWVLAAFALQLAAWTAWFVVASKHQVQEVPLEKVGRVILNPPSQDGRKLPAR